MIDPIPKKAPDQRGTGAQGLLGKAFRPPNLLALEILAMPIPKVPLAARQYLSSFDSIAIALTSKGSLIAVSNPTGYEACWWVRKQDAQRLVDAARERGNVELSAKQLGIAITPHEVALMRTDKALARLDAILADAQRNGDLKTFNRTYRAKRLAAVAAGSNYMRYNTCEKRLRRALVATIAAGVQGREFEFAMRRVFEPPRDVLQARRTAR
jgi:hypothetical protein